MTDSVSGRTDLLSAPSGTQFPVSYRVDEVGVGQADIGSGTGNIAK